MRYQTSDQLLKCEIERPEYTLHFNESIVVAKNKKIFKIIQLLCIILFVISIFFQKMFFYSCFGMIFISIFVVCYIQTKHHLKLSPIEIWFYKGHMAVYRTKVMYSEKRVFREFYDFYYEDVDRVISHGYTHEVVIHGKGHFIQYTYKDDVLSPEPSKEMIKSMRCVIRPSLFDNMNIMREIRDYLPIAIKYKN